MKNQYFCDISDYYKYGLLRLITKHTNLNIGVCWMLTKDDDKKNDKRKQYLSQPERWQHYDPNLYEFLKDCYCHGNDITKIDKTILPACKFHSPSVELEDNAGARQQYFNEFKRLAQSCDLLFFDPDTGMEVPSTRYGYQDSSKFLYWCEARQLYELGYSVLIFQHHKRYLKHEDLISRLREESLTNIGNVPSFYRTTYATFLLIAQNTHLEIFKDLNKTIEAAWQHKIKVEVSQKL